MSARALLVACALLAGGCGGRAEADGASLRRYTYLKADVSEAQALKDEESIRQLPGVAGASVHRTPQGIGVVRIAVLPGKDESGRFNDIVAREALIGLGYTQQQDQ